MNASPPRLLVVTPDFPPSRGGIQLLMARLVEHLTASEVLVMTRSANAAARDERRGHVRVRRTALPRSGRASLAAVNAAAVRHGLRFRPEVVVCGHVALAPAAALIRRSSGAPVVTYLHADEVPAFPRLSRLAGRTSSTIVAVSRYTRAMAVGCGLPSEKMTVIPPGVDDPPASAGVAGRPAGAPSRLVTIARLADRYKGHDVMLEAVRLLARRGVDAEWVVVGDGPLRVELERRARTFGVADRVRFVGAVPDAERDALLESAHVFVMPSRLPEGGAGGEGFGIAYMEASARGLPCIAGGVAGAVDAVIDGVTGLLVDPTDAAAVASAVERLVSDPALAARMGAAGRARAEQFAWPVIAGRVDEVIERARGGA